METDLPCEMIAKKLIATSFLLTSFLLIGCSRGFEVANPGHTDQDSSSSGTDGSAGVSSLNSSGNFSTSRGEIKTQMRSLEDETVSLDLEMNIPFGRIYSTMSNIVREFAPQFCKLTKDLYSTNSSAYLPGEVSCGVPYSADWKKIVDVQIDDFSKDGGTVYAFNFPVLLSRTQYRGYYTEDRLDNRKAETLLSSANVGEDVSIRYVPNGSSSRTELCLNIPGAAIRSPEMSIRAKLEKKVLGVKVSKTSNFLVDPGQAKYSYSRGCFAMDLGWVNGQGIQASLLTTEAVRLTDIQYEGFNIRIQDWFLRLVDNVMAFFKSSIRQKIIQQVKSTVTRVAENDIETGLWFSRIQGEEMVQKAGQNLSKKAQEVISRIGAITSEGQFKTLLSDNCRLLKYGADKWNSRLDGFCQNVIDKVEISAVPFVVHQKSKELGCYNHFANIHSTKLSGNAQWWSTECKLSSRLNIKIPASYRDYLKELLLVLETHIAQKQVPDRWKDKLEKLQIDSYELRLILKEMEARGINQISSSDWNTTIPTIISELTAKDLL